jgi:tetratricopeptide (TPR) repeat protein
MSVNKHSEHYMTFHTLSNHSRVKYYEEKIKNNLFLDYSERTELEIEYIFALFEIGKYQKIIDNIDPIIEYVVIENFEKVNNIDAFEALLFKKAASLFNLTCYDEAIQITRQLININPKNHLYKHLLNLTIKKQKYKSLNQINYFGVLSLFFGILFSILDIFIIDPFYTGYHQLFTIVKDTFFTIGIIIIVTQYIYYLRRNYGK